MNEHVINLVDGYLDGELSSQQIQFVAEHLSTCAACRTFVSQRQNLSSLLQEAPPAVGLKPATQFAGEIVQLLQPDSPPPLTWLAGARNWFRDPLVWRLGWFGIPVLLLLASIFMRVAGVLSVVLTIIPGPASQVSQWFASFLPASEAQWVQPLSGLIMGMVGFNLGNLNWVTYLILMVAIGLLYLAWIAGNLSSSRIAQARVIE